MVEENARQGPPKPIVQVATTAHAPLPTPEPVPTPTLKKHLNRKSIRIRVAALRDAKQIAALVEGLGTPSPKGGGLFAGYGVREYEDFALRADHFLVLLLGNTVRAFLLAYSCSLITYDHAYQLAGHIRDNLCRDFVFINQVATATGFMHKGFAQALYKELYARVLHFHARLTPIFAAIDGNPPPPRAIMFHNRAGFQQETVKSNADGTSSLIFSHRNLRMSLNDMMTSADLTSSPLYTAHAMADENCVGVGICVNTIAPPDETGAFYADLRIMFKWRQKGIEEHCSHPRRSSTARTMIDLANPPIKIRVPRYALNKLHADESSAPYAYIDKDDPPDVITMQLLLRGTFNCPLNLSDFPADTQMLPFRFSMLNSDLDDCCRYFRQLPTVDGTAWQVCVKGKITSVECTFLANQVHLGIDPVTNTSFLQVDVPCLRKPWYFIRTVALPLFLISSLAITSFGIPQAQFADRGSQNGGLLLTAVAFMFIAKEGLPRVECMTRLDTFTTGAFFIIWIMTMFQFVSVMVELDEDVDFWVGIGLVSLDASDLHCFPQLCMTVCMGWGLLLPGAGLLVFLAYKILRLVHIYHQATSSLKLLGDIEFEAPA